MSRVLLVTNDFPPRPGGIQSYLGEFVGRLVGAGSHSMTVYAPQWKGAEAHDEAHTAHALKLENPKGRLLELCMRRRLPAHAQL